MRSGTNRSDWRLLEVTLCTLHQLHQFTIQAALIVMNQTTKIGIDHYTGT